MPVLFETINIFLCSAISGYVWFGEFSLFGMSGERMCCQRGKINVFYSVRDCVMQDAEGNGQDTVYCLLGLA